MSINNISISELGMIPIDMDNLDSTLYLIKIVLEKISIST